MIAAVHSASGEHAAVEKAWAGLAAKSAMAGCMARRFELEDGRVRYEISRWHWPAKQFDSISAAEAFVRRVAGELANR